MVQIRQLLFVTGNECVCSSYIWNAFCGRWNPTKKTRRHTRVNSMKYSEVGYYMRCAYNNALSSIPSRWRLCSVVRAATIRLGASREKFDVRRRTHESVVEKTMGGVQ